MKQYGISEKIMELYSYIDRVGYHS